MWHWQVSLPYTVVATHPFLLMAWAGSSSIGSGHGVYNEMSLLNLVSSGDTKNAFAKISSQNLVYYFLLVNNDNSI